MVVSLALHFVGFSSFTSGMTSLQQASLQTYWKDRIGPEVSLHD
jgi:hypothetical protein